MIERGGVKIAVIGQAFPYTPIANPRWMMPNWSFGIREDDLQAQCREGAQGRRRAGRAAVAQRLRRRPQARRRACSGIDVILTAHTHDALPDVVKVGKTLLVASGSHGKFVSRLDLDVRDGEVKDYRFKLIPVFADAIAPDAEMAAKIRSVRAPHEAMLREVDRPHRDAALPARQLQRHARRRDLRRAARRARRRDRAVARLPLGQPRCCPARTITREDIYNATAITYPATYRMTMTGARLKEVLEDVADNLFNPDPYYQQGGDMVRVGGVSYTIDIGKPIGQPHLRSDAAANRQAARSRPRTTSSPAGRASTKAPKARRSGTW